MKILTILAHGDHSAVGVSFQVSCYKSGCEAKSLPRIQVSPGQRPL